MQMIFLLLLQHSPYCNICRGCLKSIFFESSFNFKFSNSQIFKLIFMRLCVIENFMLPLHTKIFR
jgi:hypothetical protein